MADVEFAAQMLGSEKGEQQGVCVDATHEDANDLAVLVPLDALFRGRQREALPETGLDGGRGRRDEVAELVGGADDKGAKGAGRQLHEVDGDDAPGALDAELLEKGGGHDGLVADEAVGVQQGAANDAAEHDAEAAADRLAAEADDGAARHGAQVGDDLRHRHSRLAEAELVLEHGRVQILRAVAHEVEAGHEQHEVGEQQPVPPQGHLALADEDGAGRLADVPGLVSHALALLEHLRLGQHEADGNENDGGAGGEPVQRAPGMRRGVDEAAGKGGAEEVAKGIL